MNGAASAYGLWSLVVINSLVFIIFAFSFAKPQYVGFVLIMVGFLFQWPTLVTLTMFPILVFMYARLARREERDALAEFGDTYRAYMHEVPAFVPNFGSHEDGRTSPPHAQSRGE